MRGFWRAILLAIGLGLIVGVGTAQEFEVVGYNVESGDAQPTVVAQHLAEIDAADIWGLCEVQNQSWADTFEAALDANGDFVQIFGTTGGGDRLAIFYNDEMFDLVSHEELDHINVGGHVRAPLVARLKEQSSGTEFFFMVNHLYRSRASQRHLQATLLNEWALQQQLPVIAVGDYNYTYHIGQRVLKRHNTGAVSFRPHRASHTNQCPFLEGSGRRFLLLSKLRDSARIMTLE